MTLILREDYPDVMVKVYRVDGRAVAPQNVGRRRLLQTRFVNSCLHVPMTFGKSLPDIIQCMDHAAGPLISQLNIIQDNHQCVLYRHKYFGSRLTFSYLSSANTTEYSSVLLYAYTNSESDTMDGLAVSKDFMTSNQILTYLQGDSQSMSPSSALSGQKTKALILNVCLPFPIQSPSKFNIVSMVDGQNGSGTDSVHHSARNHRHSVKL